MDTRELSARMREAGLTVREGTIEQRVAACIRAVEWCIRPASVSDRTCMRRIGDWLIEQCQSGIHSPHELLARVIDHALEASKPECHNPRAVFMYLVKKELRYAA